METLVHALDHFVILYRNHPRPLRLTLVNPPEPARLLERLTKFLNERRNTPRRLPALDVTVVATAGHRDRLIAASTLEGRAQDLVYEKVSAGRLELRVARDTRENLDRLVREDLSKRPQHLIAIFDESSISVRRQRVERLLPMSPFCVRNEIVVDRMLGDISLSPHPGEPPFSDFVMMIHEFEREQRDSTMIASADADRLRSTIDNLLLEDRSPARWVFLADRALPPESGMKSIRLLQRKEGHRQVLLSAANYGRVGDPDACRVQQLQSDYHEGRPGPSPAAGREPGRCRTARHDQEAVRTARQRVGAWLRRHVARCAPAAKRGFECAGGLGG